MAEFEETSQRSFKRLQAWFDRNGLQGYDPYDALSNPLLANLGKLSNLAGQVAIQSLLYLPINIRSLLGIKKEYDAKALGLLARGCFLVWDRTRTEEDWAKGVECLTILDTLKIPGFSGACWGHPFPYRSRRGLLPANRPSIVSTFYAAQAFLDAYERAGSDAYLQIACSACDFILEDLVRIPRGDTFCFNYLSDGRWAIHNANLLAVQLIVRLARITGNTKLIEIVQPALAYTLQDQNLDGSWLYDGPDSASRHNTFIDGFHTGFILESLWDIMQDSGIDLSSPIQRGLAFYLDKLFLPSGQPLRMVGQFWPLDLRDCAQALIILYRLHAQMGIPDLIVPDRVLEWTVRNLQSPRGYFYFRRFRRFVINIPYIRFQAWMFVALATAIEYRSAPKHHS